jgi:hypothetical protein
MLEIFDEGCGIEEEDRGDQQGDCGKVGHLNGA